MPFAGSSLNSMTGCSAQCPSCRSSRSTPDVLASTSTTSISTHPYMHWARPSEHYDPAYCNLSEPPSHRPPPTESALTKWFTKKLLEQGESFAKDKLASLSKYVLLVALANFGFAPQQPTDIEIANIVLRIGDSIPINDPTLAEALSRLRSRMKPSIPTPQRDVSPSFRKVFATSPRLMRPQPATRPSRVRIVSMTENGCMFDSWFISKDELHGWMRWLGYKSIRMTGWSVGPRPDEKIASVVDASSGRAIGKLHELPFPRHLPDSYWM